MKKSFIRSSLLLLSALTLVGCGGNAESSSSSAGEQSTPAGTFDASEYEEAGKIFFYFTLTGDVTIPDYCGVYLTGGFNSWATAIEEVAVLTPVDGADNVYGGSFTVDSSSLESIEQGYEYQLTLGYTAASGSPSTGVNWSYKSDECQAGSGESGTENLSFTLSSSGLSVNLGNHTWSAVPSEVTIVEDIDVQITFAEAVPSWINLYMPGNFINNWNTTDIEANIMTPSNDRKTFTINIPKINLGTFEAKIIAEYSDITAYSWGVTVLDNGEGGNFTLGILKKYGGSVYNLNDQYTCTSTDFTQDSDGNIVVDWSKVLPEKSAETIDVTIELTFASVTKASTILVSGGFNSWATDDAMTASEDKKVWTSKSYTLSAGLAIEFGLPLDTGWHVGIKASASDNFKVTLLDSDCTVKVAVDAANCTSLDGFIDANDSTKWEVAVGVATVEAVSDAGGTTAA